MMFKRIYSIHILLATLFFANSCGGGGSAKVKPPVFTINGALSTAQDIDPAQRNIASNICVALKSKSQNFKTTDFLGTRFIFDVKKNVCGFDWSSTTVTSTLSLRDDGTFHYVNDNTLPNDFAQTDVSGYLSQICSKINNNQPISNTTTINGIKVQIVFFKDTLDGYIVQYYSRVTNPTKPNEITYQMTSAETFKLRTQFNTTKDDIMGMDEYYSKDTTCNTDSTKSSKDEQTFKSR